MELVVSSKRESAQPDSVYLGCEGKGGERVKKFLILCVHYIPFNDL